MSKGHCTDTFYRELLLIEIYDASRMLIDADDSHIIRKHGLKGFEPILSHKTESGVVVSTFGIVPMRYEGKLYAKITEQVEAGNAANVLSDFVNLIDWEAPSTHGDRR